MIIQVGCTTPYGPNKTNICMNEGDRNKSLAMYRETYESVDHKWICHHPCNFISTSATVNSGKIGGFINGKRSTIASIQFRENIKVIEAYYLYSCLSMIAEIGGYVGMFLGISIIQITFVLDKLLSWMDDLLKHLKRRNNWYWIYISKASVSAFLVSAIFGLIWFGLRYQNFQFSVILAQSFHIFFCFSAVFLFWLIS